MTSRISKNIPKSPKTSQRRVGRIKATEPIPSLPSHGNSRANVMILTSEHRIAELEDNLAREKAHLKKLQSMILHQAPADSDAPLHVRLHLDKGGPGLSPVYQFIKKHMCRIQVLWISYVRLESDSEKILTLLSEYSAPKLKHLKVHLHPLLRSHLPDDFAFADLQKLDLHHCMFPKGIVFQKLKSLSLRSSDEANISQVFSALQSASKLETLVLDQTFSLDTATRLPVIHLPLLSTLKISSKNLQEQVVMFTHIKHPRSTNVFFCPNTYIRSPAEPSEKTAGPQRLATIIESRFSVQRLCINFMSKKLIDMQLSASKPDETLGTVNVRLSRCPDDALFPAFAHSMTQLETLVIKAPNEFMSNSFVIFGNLPQLKNIILCGSPSEAVFVDFRRAAPGTRHIGFVSLRVLKIEGWEFDKHAIDSLVASFQIRKGLGLQLRILAIVKRRFSGKNAKVSDMETQVRSLAENLIWDVETITGECPMDFLPLLAQLTIQSLESRKMESATSLRLQVYRAWVDAWLSTSTSTSTTDKPTTDASDASVPTLERLAVLLRDENLSQLQSDLAQLERIVTLFKHLVRTNQLTMGGRTPPSCDETSILSERYDPRTKCVCSGLYPVPLGLTVEDVVNQSGCHAIRNMVEAANTVNERLDEWNIHDIFTKEKLRGAVAELVLANSDEQPPPRTCHGPVAEIPPIQAPDRRPDPRCDTELSVYHRLYPTDEQIKICADAKYFFAIACGAGLTDEGLARAIGDSGNDILIADYCEAAEEETLSTLQRVGAAAMAFLKLCNMAGVITDWQFECNVTLAIQFRVVGHYRDHARARAPGGVYGSRMSGLVVHRHVDLGIFVGVMHASVATGEQPTEKEYMELAEVCMLLNDLIDFRSDMARRQRENPVLRGVRGCLCEYLDGLMSRCIEKACKAIRYSRLQAFVVMAFCNWDLMSSHHKIFELVTGVREVAVYPCCEYMSMSDGRYEQLLEALAVYGTLGDQGPRVTKRRAEMDMAYHQIRLSPETHLAWLADCTRSLLDPVNLRKIVDVVHFEWKGHVGDVEYCP
ncbi:hypothetical protein H0H92_009119 [Tricholoma furcatifolium]|nr:hypothetical protein H0H92_009119 [Tricholoma furcatifolium]